MVVAVGELDLELHAGEEGRRWVEDEAVGAGVELLREARPSVVVRRHRGHGSAPVTELDGHAGRRPSGGPLAREEP